MQNIDKIRQIHNEGVIKMQIVCLLVLRWRTAQDPRARIHPSPPLTACWLRGGRETELGKTKGLSYRRPAGGTPHHRAPKERRRPHRNGRHCAGKEQAGPHTRPQIFTGLQKGSGCQGKPNNSSSGHVFFGTTARNRSFLQVGETWHQNSWKTLH